MCKGASGAAIPVRSLPPGRNTCQHPSQSKMDSILCLMSTKSNILTKDFLMNTNGRQPPSLCRPWSELNILKAKHSKTDNLLRPKSESNANTIMKLRRRQTKHGKMQTFRSIVSIIIIRKLKLSTLWHKQ